MKTIFSILEVSCFIVAGAAAIISAQGGDFGSVGIIFAVFAFYLNRLEP